MYSTYSPKSENLFLFQLLCFILLPKEFCFGASAQDLLLKTDTELPDLPSNLLCFGDFNSDRYTDLASVSQNQSNILQIHVQNFNRQGLTQTLGNGHQKLEHEFDTVDFNILRATAADFNYDGRLDILIYGFVIDNSLSSKQKRYESRIYYQKNSTSDEYFAGFEKSSDIFDERYEPTVLDFNGNQHPDLLFPNPDNANLTVYINKYNKNNQRGRDSKNFLKLNLKFGNLEAPISNIHSNAFVDLNGDCRPDLVLTRSDPNIAQRSYIEIYLFSHKSDFLTTSSEHFLLPNKTFIVNEIIGFITFFDFDNDGNIDMLIPQIKQSTGETSLHIFFNKQKQVANTDLCIGVDDAFVDLNLDLFGSENMKNDELHIVHSSNEISNNSEIRIRVGDINRDGLPDLIVPLKKNKVGLQIMEEKSRKWRLPEGNFEKIFNIEPTLLYDQVTFFDIGDNGVLDFIALIKNSTNKKYFTRFFKNVYEYDKLFIKTLGLNGLSSRTSPKKYGVNQVGFTTKFRTQDGVSNKQTFVLPQLTQNSFKALQTPYSITGIGKSYNYIIIFFMGFHVISSENNENHFRYQESSIIPNSQLILFPHKPNYPYNWHLELQLDRSRSLLQVGVGVASLIFLLTLIVQFFHRNETRQDAADKARNLIAF